MSDASYTQVTGKLDLIDRREILRTWQNVCIGISCSQCQFYNDDAMSGDCLLERWVHSLPSAEPEKAKRGFWYTIEKGDKGYSAGDFRCSVCNEPNHTWIPNPNFCPKCGADMRGEQDETD